MTVLGWLLLPYAALLISGSIALVAFNLPDGGYAWIPCLVAGASILWVANRWRMVGPEALQGGETTVSQCCKNNSPNSTTASPSQIICGWR